MSRHFWILTRPKRKLIIVPELLKVFSAVAVGKQWSGNRELQAEFEQKLVDFQWKAQNLSKDSSGSRTYAALLSMLGLWYEEDGMCYLTQAGKEIVSGEPAVPILTKQILNLQYPSPYSHTPSVSIDHSFTIQPHRFIISLLLDPRIARLSKDELAYCVIPFAKNARDLEACIARILRFASSRDSAVAEALAISGSSAKNLENIANTFINQLEYTGFFTYRETNPHLEFEPNGRKKAIEAIEAYGRNIVAYTDGSAVFQKRYGSGLNTSKDYTGVNPVPPSINPADRIILVAYYEITQNRPLFGISKELISEVSSKTGIDPRQVENVLSKFASQPLLDRFEESYIILSKGGTDTATEFELVTKNVFSKDGFGIAAEWVGKRGAYPDIFVYYDKIHKKHGIVDTKAYKEYTLPIDHRNKMAHTYIPRFSTVTFEGEEYTLDFFTYIAGGFGANMQASFNQLRADCGDISGSYITSYNFIQLLRRHRVSPFTAESFSQIFSMNEEIKYDELYLG